MLSPTLATESATVRLFFLSALLCSVNKAGFKTDLDAALSATSLTLAP